MDASTEQTEVRDDELLIVRTLNAPASLVFRIWADRDHMRRWLGPKDFTCTVLDMDFRPGGKWRGMIASDVYGEVGMAGEYREIEKDRKIVYTFAWEEEDAVETLVTVTFREEGGRTVQSFRQTPFVSVESRDSHVGGWNECFDREQAYAEGLARDAA